MSKRRPTKRRIGPQPSWSDSDEPPNAATTPPGTSESASTTASTTPSGQAVQPQPASTRPPSGTASSSKVPGNPELYAQMQSNFGRALAMMPPDELRRMLDEAQAESLKPFEER